METPWGSIHITVLILRALYLALKALLPFIHGRHDLIRTYSSSTLYHTNHHKGTRSLWCFYEAPKLLLLCSLNNPKEELVSDFHLISSLATMCPASQVGPSLQGRWSDMATQSCCPAPLAPCPSPSQVLNEPVLKTKTKARSTSIHSNYEQK